jgi:hypothetical protein
MTETHLGPTTSPAAAVDQAKTGFFSDLKRQRKVRRVKKEKPVVKEVLDNWAEELGLRPDGDVTAAVNPQAMDQTTVYLSALLAMTRGVYEVAHSLHWRTSGTDAYQDHLLFERVYNEVYSFIDGIGEKVIGLTQNHKAVEANLQSRATARFIALLPASQDAAGFPGDLLHATTELLRFIEGLLIDLENIGGLTAGLDNFIQGMADKVETLVMLLQQRVASHPVP